jgi:undecaprenyl-diphosphatase
MDQYLFHLINDLAGKFTFLDSLGVFLGEYLGYILIVLVPIIFWKQWKKVFFVGVAAVLAKFGIVELVRLFWQKPRPFLTEGINLLVDKSNSPSFPSGHAAVFFAISTVVFYYNKKAGICFFVASILLSISRVYIGVHWPLDIAAGAVAGIFSGWLITRIAKRF